MQLTNITIKNYRSIDNALEVDFSVIPNERKAFFLFGINETGKTNLLKGCRFLDPAYHEQYTWERDCFKENKKKNQMTQFDYFLSFTEDDMKTIHTLLDSELSPMAVKRLKGIRMWVEMESNSKPGYNYEILFNKDEFTTFRQKISTSPTQKVESTEAEPAPSAEPEEELPLVAHNLELNKDTRQYYKVLTTEEAKRIFQEHLESYLDSNLPTVVFWDSSEKYILPGTIDLNTFKDKPTELVPLFNMFKLLGYTESDIKGVVKKVLSDPTERRSLMQELSEKTTKHIKSVWKEHEVETDIVIESTGICNVYFKDKDVKSSFFEMEQRSDGFQRFISFILTLSAQNSNQELRNALILLDEPEVHLHPSGVEFLREELLKIADNNYVIAASHSVFFVDRKEIKRNLVVKKKNGKTSITSATPENPFDEEVIYRALNTSIYELIQPTNLIFEGTSDSDVFLAVRQKFRTEFPNLLTVGAIGATGAREVPKYEKFFKDNKLAQAIVVLDSDKEGRDVAKQLKDESFFSEKVFELKDIYDLGKKDFELEDLLSEDLVLECAKTLHSFEFKAHLKADESILDGIKRIKYENSLKDDKDMEVLKKSITKKLIEECNPAKSTKENFKQRHPHYLEFLKALSKKVDEL